MKTIAVNILSEIESMLEAKDIFEQSLILIDAKPLCVGKKRKRVTMISFNEGAAVSVVWYLENALTHLDRRIDILSLMVMFYL